MNLFLILKLFILISYFELSLHAKLEPCKVTDDAYSCLCNKGLHIYNLIECSSTDLNHFPKFEEFYKNHRYITELKIKNPLLKEILTET
jgi:hypothetical protein